MVMLCDFCERPGRGWVLVQRSAYARPLRFAAHSGLHQPALRRATALPPQNGSLLVVHCWVCAYHEHPPYPKLRGTALVLRIAHWPKMIFSYITRRWGLRASRRFLHRF